MPPSVNQKRKIIHFICHIVILLSILCIVFRAADSLLHNLQQQKIRQQKNQQQETHRQDRTSATDESVQNHPAVRELLPEYASLYAQNPDMAGWLSIPDLPINDPVLQNEDNSFYETHDFYGKKNSHGAVFIKNDTDVDTPDTNIVIYAHNMKDGSMFGDLDQYKKEAFYKNHPVIYFDTLYEKREYEILSVFLSKIYEEDENVFKYYQFRQAETKEDFDDFYGNIKSLSLYDTGVEACYGDTFLTLSTCSYHVTDGRLVVVARRKK